MHRNHSFALVGTLCTIITALAFAGCASSPKQANASADASKAVAKMIAKTGSAPLFFKDREAASGITGSISETSQLKFAVLLDRDLKQFSQYSAAPFDCDTQEIVESIQKRVRSGGSEFTFTHLGLSITVVPVRQDETLCGYAAVGAL
ncbi:MAG TPA: CHASE sensor domain-containing protein [Verrucomicrobiae bacterium]|nr:CHASE sensor domain-containing protein [Verrucomicrobiae bacterium]